MKRKIIWNYWQNPFGGGEKEFAEESEVEVKKWNDSYTPQEEHDIKIRPVIPTPIGLIPVHPFQDFTNSFEFWMGHVNFNITQEIKEKIEEVPGVEILDVITRYCFRISIGKAFDGSEVKLEIQKVLSIAPNFKGVINPTNIKLDSETEEKVSILKNILKGRYSFWLIYVLPNGEIDTMGGNTNKECEKYLDLYTEAQKSAGGIIFQHV